VTALADPVSSPADSASAAEFCDVRQTVASVGVDVKAERGGGGETEIGAGLIAEAMPKTWPTSWRIQRRMAGPEPVARPRRARAVPDR
jgi:hypothetical protein